MAPTCPAEVQRRAHRSGTRSTDAATGFCFLQPEPQPPPLPPRPPPPPAPSVGVGVGGGRAPAELRSVSFTWSSRGPERPSRAGDAVFLAWRLESRTQPKGRRNSYPEAKGRSRGGRTPGGRPQAVSEHLQAARLAQAPPQVLALLHALRYRVLCFPVSRGIFSPVRVTL